ncbi:hypothetical protein DEU56DRAFT_548061 [Suillus clintonianus]|uniref:uncharacterized protein n=1 Tax=Suillus clintonianus TaxID=1904413 RepID=UPI001B87549A|nr:uncharacterized protein DEU56DRAFT_548061 [Suillus clintonianus]KAG2151362.1 hypothetical protein DEU56DRAFT_548061 [Suillus clintonianus]
MHHALLVHEILLNILTTLREADAPYSQLNAVAQTCHFLSPLALDFLWSELPDVKPVLQYVKPRIPNDPCTSGPSASFQRAASRVRKLSCPVLACGDTYSQLALTERLQLLSTMRITTSLFPNLRRLSWTDTDRSRYVYIRLFLSPTLESLELDFFFHKPPDFPFLPLLPKLCPNLHSMSISKHSVISSSGDEGPSAVRTICRLPRLAALECKSSTISEADLLHLSQLKSLVTLSLGIPAWVSIDHGSSALHSSEAAKDHARRSWFCNLRNLHLRAYSMPIVTSFVEPGCRPLQSAVFDISEPPTTASLTECFCALYSSQCDNECSAMRSIKVRDGLSNTTFGVSQLLPDSKIITVDVFKPLFAFTKLRVFDLGVCLSFSLGDSDLTAMATSWPELEVFYLNEGRGWRPPSTEPRSLITVRGLQSMCALCPRLHQIAVVLNALDPFLPCPITSLSMRTSRQDTTLAHNLAVTHLSLGDSRLENPHDVACALSNIFPRLKSISAWQYPLDTLPEGRHHRRLWEEVNNILQQRLNRDITAVAK